MLAPWLPRGRAGTPTAPRRSGDGCSTRGPPRRPGSARTPTPRRTWSAAATATDCWWSSRRTPRTPPPGVLATFALVRAEDPDDLDVDGAGVWADAVLDRLPPGAPPPAWPELTAVRDLELVADRKSTRLNSSHANISYAVFCLKKKKLHDSRFFTH